MTTVKACIHKAEQHGVTVARYIRPLGRPGASWCTAYITKQTNKQFDLVNQTGWEMYDTPVIIKLELHLMVVCLQVPDRLQFTALSVRTPLIYAVSDKELGRMVTLSATTITRGSISTKSKSLWLTRELQTWTLQKFSDGWKSFTTCALMDEILCLRLPFLIFPCVVE